ncbi:zinc finger, C3HC4 type [Ostertagia ostertagi]
MRCGIPELLPFASPRYHSSQSTTKQNRLQYIFVQDKMCALRYPSTLWSVQGEFSSGQVAVNDEALLNGRKRDLAFHDVITLLEGPRCIRLTFSEKQAGIIDDLRPYLAWESSSYAHVRYLEEKKIFSIGSDRACDVSLPTPHLAANHATVVRNICRGVESKCLREWCPSFQARHKNSRKWRYSYHPQSVKFRFNSGDGSKARTTAAGASAKASPTRSLSKSSQTTNTLSPAPSVVPQPVNERQQVKSGRNDTITLTQLEANLTCCVCLNIFFKPINIDPCNHKCCYSCVLSWLQRNGFVGKCPQCRCTIMSVKLDPVLNSIVDTMLSMKPGLRRSSEEIRMIEEMESRNMREYQNLLQYSLTVDAFLPQPRTPWVP